MQLSPADCDEDANGLMHLRITGALGQNRRRPWVRYQIKAVMGM
jgi:hypothetical protein